MNAQDIFFLTITTVLLVTAGAMAIWMFIDIMRK